MKKILFIALLLLTLSGCCTYQTDQKERQKIFNNCLEKIPEGPEKTTFNDWAEVIQTCDSVALYQSKVRTCK